MLNTIIVLNQIADTVTLYANCFKNGYTRLCYFSDPEEITVINLSGPKIIIKELSEAEYHFYCINEQGKEAGHISIRISMVSYDIFWNNVFAYTEIKEEDLEILKKIKEPDYLLALYKTAISDKKGIDKYEELLMLCAELFNTRQESLNTVMVPEFSWKDNTITSFSEQKYRFVVYFYDTNNNTWKIVSEQDKKTVSKYTLDGKQSLMYRICVLSDVCLVREYFYYWPSKTLSEAILERRILTTRQLTEKTAEMMTRFDMAELIDDEYGQEVVCALQEIKPEYPILAMPQLTYDEMSGLFYGYFPDYKILPPANYNIYLAALEIDQVFNKNKAPHKILAAGKNFILNPSAVRMHYGEDYIFYFCDKDNNALSMPLLYDYGTETDTELYFKVSRKIDLEQYRRRLFNIFKEYDKQDWNTVSLILDKYIASTENLYRPITDYVIEDISRLDTIHFQLDYLIQLILLNQLKYYLPTNQTFINKQVYAEGYHKHVFPEAEESYIIRCGRLDKNTLIWDYLFAGDEVQEVYINKNKFLFLQAINRDMTESSPYALYNNLYTGNTRYFYYPNLEVNIVYGLY